MARKKYTPQAPSESVLKFREKRKWQLNYRRYVLEESPCPEYAPYFGLDIKSLRQWFEYQFLKGESWESFGKQWQFDHIIPVANFDYSLKEDLRLCWNFTNIRVEHFQLNKNRGHRLDVLAAKSYFQELYETTQYPVCLQLLKKIESLELSEFLSTAAQQSFIKDHEDYLKMIAGYSNFEFELLNRGRTVAQVREDIEFLKKLGK